MWISVDRYLAVRKPLRYETVQTRTRKRNHPLCCSPSLIKNVFLFLGCQCWMCFTWISAAMLCCPSLWTEQDANFDKFAYICVPNWSHMAAYSVTLGEDYLFFKSFSIIIISYFIRNSRPWPQRYLNSL